MSDTTNIELARRLMAAIDAGDDRDVDELVHAGYRDHAGTNGDGRDGMRRTIEWLGETFAERRTVVEDLIASGDRVVARVRFCATQTGEVPGIPATGRSFETEHIHIWRTADGRLAEHWMVRDDVGMMRQIGALEPVA